MSATVIMIGTYEQYRYVLRRFGAHGPLPPAVLWCPAEASKVRDALLRLRGVQILRLPYVASVSTENRLLIGKLLREARMRGNYVAVITSFLRGV